MAATVISCSTAILGVKGILQILHLQHHKGFCRKVLRANGDFDPKYKLETLLKTDFQNLSIQ